MGVNGSANFNGPVTFNSNVYMSNLDVSNETVQNLTILNSFSNYAITDFNNTVNFNCNMNQYYCHKNNRSGH